jgi:hypothetical protein
MLKISDIIRKKAKLEALIKPNMATNKPVIGEFIFYQTGQKGEG